MNFLWPAALGLSVLALPIIALYLVKSRIPRRTASTLLFWNQVQPRLIQQPFWRKLRRWLSLALQLLLLLLMIAALMQPQPAWQSAAPGRTVYVLSASASMRAHDVSPDRWGQATLLLEQQINPMRYFDEASIVLASDPPQILSGWTTSQRALKKSLVGILPSAGVADARPAVALAQNLASSREGARVVFISDGVLPFPIEESMASSPDLVAAKKAANEPESPHANEGANPPLPPLSPFHFLPVGTTEALNTGITLFSARRSAVAPGEYQIVARVESNSREASTVEFELRRDSHLMDVQTIHLVPGKPWEKSWKDSGNEASHFAATISGMSRDDLVEDNQAAAEVPALRKISILLVSPSNAFLEALLNSLDLIEWKRIEPGKERAADLQAADLVIYSKCLPLPQSKSRAVVLIAPEGQGFWGKSGEELETPLISEWQKESIPLRFVSLDQVRLTHAKVFTPTPGSVVLAESFGHPLIFGDWDAEALPRWLVLGFDLEQSDFVLRTAFPVVLGNIIQSLRPTEQASITAPLPGPLCTQLTSTLPASASTQAELPLAGKYGFSSFLGLGWLSHPAWWWLVVLGALLLLLEWRLYSRRITE